MEMPDVWALLKYWRAWPPEHELIRMKIGYKPPAEPGESNLNPFERKVVASSGDSRSFDSLPLPVQEALMREAGYSSITEWKEALAKQAN